MQSKILEKFIMGALVAVAAGSAMSGTRTVCTVAMDASTGKILAQEGDCNARVTPASTYKIALSLMGFDSGILQDDFAPSFPFKEGYPDWGGEAWRQPTDPTRWMKYSVVWFSHQVAQQLGQSRLAQYTRSFQYGNGDVRGEPGKNNGVSGAWINSSLRISPLEQVRFMQSIVNRKLPVKSQAYEMTSRITRIDASSTDFDIHGKTGTGSPGADGKYDAARAYGWFVGWATKGPDSVVFAHLIQDDQPTTPNAGLRARDEVLRRLPLLMNRISH